MNKKLIPLLFAGIVGQGYAQTPIQKDVSHVVATSSSEIQKNITKPKVTYTAVKLSQEQKNIIDTTIQSYNAFFQCGIKNVTITAADEASPNDEDAKNTPAYVQKDTIFLNPQDIPTDKNKLEDIIIHELFHVLKPNTATAIIPCELDGGYSMTGYHGLSVQVGKGKDSTQFVTIEEAAAIACAYAYKNTYSVQNPYYANIGSLMIKMVKHGWIDYKDLIQAQKTNGLDSLATKIYDKKTAYVDIEDMMKTFNMVSMSEGDLTDQAIKNIADIRASKK